MNWFKIKLKTGIDEGYTFAGSSPDSLETLIGKASRGEYLRLDNLLYYYRGEIKDWAEWDNREVPMVCINPANVIAIQQFKGDPRTLPLGNTTQTPRRKRRRTNRQTST